MFFLFAHFDMDKLRVCRGIQQNKATEFSIISAYLHQKIKKKPFFKIDKMRASKMFKWNESAKWNQRRGNTSCEEDNVLLFWFDRLVAKNKITVDRWWFHFNFLMNKITTISKEWEKKIKSADTTTTNVDFIHMPLK